MQVQNKEKLSVVEKNTIEVLKSNIGEMRKERDLLEKQLNNWKENAVNYQNQLRVLQNKVPDQNEGRRRSNTNVI